jgi:anti-sigma B factor antagonist
VNRTLTITALAVPTGTVLTLAGDLHLHTAPQLREAVGLVVLANGQQLILDLAALDFCDSSGIAALVAAYRHAGNAEATFALTALSDRITRLLTIVGLDQLLTIHPTTAEAQSAWTPPVPGP